MYLDSKYGISNCMLLFLKEEILKSSLHLIGVYHEKMLFISVNVYGDFRLYESIKAEGVHLVQILHAVRITSGFCSHCEV